MRLPPAMAPSGPCGSGRLDTSSTSSRLAPYPLLSCNIEHSPEPISPINRQVFANWHVACCVECAKHKHWAVGPAGVQACQGESHMAKATLTISSKNYSSW